MKKLDRLDEKITQAQLALKKEIQKTYPIGTHICFEKGRGTVTAIVTSNDYCHWTGVSLGVENINTGAEYKQSFYKDNWPQIVKY